MARTGQSNGQIALVLLSLPLIIIFIGLGISIWGGYLLLNPASDIEWTTISEFGTSGFNIYRYVPNTQELIKINESMIQSSLDPLTGGKYHFEDHDVEHNQKYLYVLKEVTTTGSEIKIGELLVEINPKGNLNFLLGSIIVIIGSFTFVYMYKRRNDFLNPNIK